MPRWCKKVTVQKVLVEKVIVQVEKVPVQKQWWECMAGGAEKEEERKEAERNGEFEAKKKEDRQKKRNAEKILAEQKILLEKKQDEENKEAKRKRELKEAKRKRELEEKKKEDDRKDLEKIEMETIRKRQEEMKLKTLDAEIKSSPRPDAVCRLENCKKVQSSALIIPAKNIYSSDPNYKGYYKVYCYTNCQICYHKACWMTVKGKRIEKGNLVKGPTEKDLLGLTCFTPDCGAVIVKIEIIEDNGKVTTIQDMKMIEKLEVDERKLKEESRLKKKIKNDKERFKIFEKKQYEKESYLKRSYKGEKEKSKCSNEGEKEKSENAQMKINSTVLEKDDRHFKLPSHEIVVGKKVLHEESISQDPILGESNKKLGTRLKPSAPDTEELLLKEKILSSVVTIQETKQESVTKNAASAITTGEAEQPSTQTDSSRLDPLGLHQRNECLENNGKCMAMAQEIKNLKNENDVHKEHISKMKKTVSDATKTSNELKKTCEELRAKLLHNEFKNYREILAQRRANNQRLITHLIGSSELNPFPQDQIALNTLNEFSARLLLAEEELHDKYKSLMRQSRNNKVILELDFDLSCVEPPNLEPAYLSLLHSFIIMDQSSSLPTSSPFSTTPVLPPSIPQSSSTSSARDCPHGPQVVTRPSPTPPTEYKRITLSFSGNPEFSSSLAGPKICSRSGGTLKDSFATATSRFTSSPTNFSAPDSSMTQSRKNVDHYKNLPRSVSSSASLPPGSNVKYPSNEVPFTTPSSGATATCLTPSPSGPTLIPKNSATTCSTGPNLKTGKQHDDLVCRVQTDHPSLSREQAHNYVMEVRASNNGKLSGMVRKDILNKVDSFIRRDRGIVGGASAVERNGSNVDAANAEDNNCSICFEAMISSDCIFLNPCRHRFHTDCINQWMEAPGGAGSTCPMCRNYIVKEEEFPNLGQGDRRF